MRNYNKLSKIDQVILQLQTIQNIWGVDTLGELKKLLNNPRFNGGELQNSIKKNYNKSEII